MRITKQIQNVTSDKQNKRKEGSWQKYDNKCWRQPCCWGNIDSITVDYPKCQSHYSRKFIHFKSINNKLLFSHNDNSKAQGDKLLDVTTYCFSKMIILFTQ